MAANSAEPLFALNLRRPLIRVVLLREVRFRAMLVCVIAAGASWAIVAAQAQDIASLEKQAKKGDAEAQYEMAEAYLNGTSGASKDSKQGLEWLQKAANLEHPAAQNALWVMYRNGFPPSIPKDPKQGLEWLRKSSGHQYAPAEYNLALLYRDGDGETGIPRDPHVAASWFRKAARQPGSTKSQASLGEMLQKGLITEREANWQAAEPTVAATVADPRKEPRKGAATAFSLGDVETGLTGGITSKRMTTLVQKFGVDFKLSSVTRKRLADEGADNNLLQTISASKRSL